MATGSSGWFSTARARGAITDPIPITILPFIKDPGTLGEEIRRLASLTTDILIDTGAVISAMPLRAVAYRERRGSCLRCGKTGLICEARSRGLSRQGPSLPRQRQDDRRRRRSRRRRARLTSPSTMAPRHTFSSAPARRPKRIAASKASSTDWHDRRHGSAAISSPFWRRASIQSHRRLRRRPRYRYGFRR